MKIKMSVVLAVAVAALVSVNAFAENCAPESKALKVYACKKGTANDWPTCVEYSKMEASGGCEYGPFDSSKVDMVFAFAKKSDEAKIKDVYYKYTCDKNSGQAGGFEFERPSGYKDGVGGDLDWIPNYSAEKLPSLSDGERRDKAKDDLNAKGEFLIKKIVLRNPANASVKEFDKQTCTIGDGNVTLIKLTANITGGGKSAGSAGSGSEGGQDAPSLKKGLKGLFGN